MHREETSLAEVSCLKKLQFESENDSVIAVPHSSGNHVDVEKAEVKDKNGPVTSQTIISSPNTPDINIKGVLEPNLHPDSDSSSITAYDEKDDFPEGGFKSYAVVLGAWCGSFAVFGIINSTAILLEYFSTHQLQDNSPSQIGWIFGLALFLTFFCGAPVGPIFDAYGPRALMLAGSILLVASMFLLGLCTRKSPFPASSTQGTSLIPVLEYWHFIMVYSVLNGLGGCLINTPCIASIGHYFLTKRGNATGIAMTSGSIGGIIFPLMLQRLFPAVGFAWATRILGFILVFLLAIANMLVRSRLPRKPMASLRSVSPNFRLFKDIPFFLVALGIFLMEWGIFVPLTYLSSYTTSHGQTSAFGFQIIAMLNGGSFLGRFIAGLVADMIGRVNTLILSICMCVITCLALWLPAGNSTPMIIVFAVIFGFVSGSNLSLSPVCVGQMCKTEQYGRYFATCWMFVAFGTLTALPIGGQILTACGGNYNGLIIFAGLSYVGAAISLTAARVLKVGWKIKVIY